MDKRFQGLTFAAALLALAGCSAHNDSPLTPSIVGTTPTYRSTVRSTDVPFGAYYSQPGVNSGPPAPLPVIASQDRWDPNDPVATQVYTTLSGSDAVHLQFLRVYAHNGVIWLQGSVATKDEAVLAAQIARTVRGVATVKNDLRVAKSPA